MIRDYDPDSLVCDKHIMLWEIVLVKFSLRNQNTKLMYSGNKDKISNDV